LADGPQAGSDGYKTGNLIVRECIEHK